MECLDQLGTVEGTIFKSIAISNSLQQHQAFTSEKKAFLAHVVENLNNRFPSDASDTVSSFSALDLSNVFVKNRDAKLKVLLKHYCTPKINLLERKRFLH